MSENDRELTAIQQLIAVHDYFRQLLTRLGEELDRLGTDQPPADLTVRLADLRAHCLYFCGGLTMHHSLEDRQMFPALRNDHPALGPVIDRLETEHEKVAAYIHQIERTADAVSEANGDALAKLRDELSRLATDLLAHLSYEEESLADALSVPMEPS